MTLCLRSSSLKFARFLELLLVLWHLQWGCLGGKETLDLGNSEHLLLVLKVVQVTYCSGFMIHAKVTRWVLTACVHGLLVLEYQILLDRLAIL